MLGQPEAVLLLEVVPLLTAADEPPLQHSLKLQTPLPLQQLQPLLAHEVQLLLLLQVVALLAVAVLLTARQLPGSFLLLQESREHLWPQQLLLEALRAHLQDVHLQGERQGDPQAASQGALQQAAPHRQRQGEVLQGSPRVALQQQKQDPAPHVLGPLQAAL